MEHMKMLFMFIGGLGMFLYPPQPLWWSVL